MLTLKPRTKNNKIQNEWDEAYSDKDFPNLKMCVTVMTDKKNFGKSLLSGH